VADAGQGAVVLAFARGGGPVLGLAEGFEALCALGLLPGRVTAPAGDDAAAVSAHMRVEGRATPFTSAIPAGRVMTFGGAQAVGLRFELGEPDALEARGQVVFRYCDAAGGPLSPALSPPGVERENGGRSSASRAQRTRATDAAQLPLSSVPLIPPAVRARAIAGVCSEASNVVGVLTTASTIDGAGAQLLASLRMHLRGKR
jgi:hypothetical protein